MKVLMTGSHGFVGSNLMEALESTHNIIRWDAREDKPFPDVYAVIHLAGLAHDTKNVTEPERYFEVNTELTKRMYDRFLESKAKMFIFFSSIKAQDGDTAYARSKKQAEDYILNTDVTDKLFYILRPCMIYGKGNKGNLNLLVKWVKNGLPWPLAAFENKRSFAAIGNVCYVVNQILQHKIESGIYNICDDEPVSTNKLIGLICECLGKDVRLWCIPPCILRVFAKMGNIMHLPLNSERLQKLTEDYVVDNSQTKKVIGIEKMPINVEDGLRTTINEMIRNK